MSVSYEELDGSPKIKSDRKGGSATRMFKIAWVDISAFFVELFPYPFSGYPAVSWVPGYSWLLAQSAEAEPFNNTKPGGVNVGSGITFCDIAKVTVQYAPPSEDQQQQSTSDGSPAGTGGGGDGTGPGGKGGGTGGQKGTTKEPVVLMTHELHIGAEFLTISNLLLKFESDGKDAEPGVRAGRLVPTIEHQVTWHNVNEPPWVNIRFCAGTVNGKNGFLNAPRETVLFLGAEASRDLTDRGNKAWTLKYKFSEKDLETPRGKGWNHFYRADKNAKVKIDRLLTKPDGLPVYQWSDFESLYNVNVAPPMVFNP